jgi:hypothetical protein
MDAQRVPKFMIWSNVKVIQGSTNYLCNLSLSHTRAHTHGSYCLKYKSTCYNVMNRILNLGNLIMVWGPTQGSGCLALAIVNTMRVLNMSITSLNQAINLWHHLHIPDSWVKVTGLEVACLGWTTTSTTSSHLQASTWNVLLIFVMETFRFD